MNLLNLILCLLASILLSNASALAGGGSGGGGNGMECRHDISTYTKPLNNSVVPIKSSYNNVVLLEFHEAERGLAPFDNKLVIPRFGTPVEEQVEAAIKRLADVNSIFATEVGSAYEYIKSRKEHREDYRIEPTNDVVQPLIESSRCTRVGLGQYIDLPSIDRLYYDKETLDKMDFTDQAGFWLHEAIYFVLRRNSQHINSLQTRLIVGHLFSRQGLKPLSLPPVNNPTVSLYCKKMNLNDDSYKYSAYIYIKNDEVTFVPEYSNSSYTSNNMRFYDNHYFLFQSQFTLKMPELTKLIENKYKMTGHHINKRHLKTEHMITNIKDPFYEDSHDLFLWPTLYTTIEFRGFLNRNNQLEVQLYINDVNSPYGSEPKLLNSKETSYQPDEETAKYRTRYNVDCVPFSATTSKGGQ